MVAVVSHSGRFTPLERSPSAFNSRCGVLQSRSKRFRGELKLMPLLRIEPKFIGWVCIRTGTVYLTVAFRNVGNAHKWSRNVFGIYLSYKDGKIWF